MKRKAPANRRQFHHPWDEVGYLYDKLVYWLYDRADARRALPYADRLEKVLARVPHADEAIWPQECRSLIAEARGDLAQAVRHRENEVRLIRRLHEIAAGTPGQDFIGDRYDVDDVSDRLDLLAILYHDAGHLDRAIRTLEESKRLCERHRMPFQGPDLLRDYRREEKARAIGRASAASE
jgi:hypothetical protein